MCGCVYAYWTAFSAARRACTIWLLYGAYQNCWCHTELAFCTKVLLLHRLQGFSFPFPNLPKHYRVTTLQEVLLPQVGSSQKVKIGESSPLIKNGRISWEMEILTWHMSFNVTCPQLPRLPSFSYPTIIVIGVKDESHTSPLVRHTKNIARLARLVTKPNSLKGSRAGYCSSCNLSTSTWHATESAAAMTSTHSFKVL